MKLNTLYKRATNGKITEWTIQIVENNYRTTSGYTDGVKTTSEWTVCKGKNTGRANETTAEEQAHKEAKALWDKKVDSGYRSSVDQIDTKSFFSPMLAKDWDDCKDEVKYPLYSQPKLDGIRCIVTKDGMFSRNGKKIVSAPHIFKLMSHLFVIDPSLIFDGELYADKLANDFNRICSLVKKTKPTKEDLIECENTIEYHIYDLPSNSGTFTERYASLQSIDLPYCCVVVETSLVESPKDVETLYGDYIDDGYEGQILRQDKRYECKRTKSLLKHKSFTDEEFVIVGVEEGGGNLMGMVGALVLESKTGSNRFRSSVNGGWEYLTQLWKDFGKNPKTLIGNKATVTYFNLTPDGIPRFPKVKCVRDYE